MRSRHTSKNIRHFRNPQGTGADKTKWPTSTRNSDEIVEKDTFKPCSVVVFRLMVLRMGNAFSIAVVNPLHSCGQPFGRNI